jgi:hypothetical protein
MSKVNVTREIMNIDRGVDQPLKRFGSDTRLEGIKSRWKNLKDICQGQNDYSKVNGRHVAAISSKGSGLLNSQNIDDFLRKFDDLEGYIKGMF